MQTLKNHSSIKISMENKQLLANRKKKYKVKSINQVISVLLEKEKEAKVLKRAERKKIKNVPIAIATEKLKPSIETAPTFKIVLRSDGNNCVFKAMRQVRNDGRLYCAKDYAETGKLHVVTEAQCFECFQTHEKVTYEKLMATPDDMVYELLHSFTH
jgi:hypothetical protein